jgi:pimeloyl-ACP methyl ester carboxylesterase
VFTVAQFQPGARTALAALVIVGAGIAAAYLSSRSHRVRRFAYAGQPLAGSEYALLAARPRWRACSLDVEGGIRLLGLERPASSSLAPWILFFPGNAAHPLEDGQRFIDAVIGDRPWGGVVWAYRGSDGSSGAPTPAALASDGARERAWLVSDESVDRSRVHVVGFSLGTSVAVAVASLDRQEPPRTLTLLAPLTEIDLLPADGQAPQRYETLAELDAVSSPTFLIHGARDDVLPIEGARAIAKRLGARARLVEFPALGHLDLPSSVAVTDAVRAFVAERAP